MEHMRVNVPGVQESERQLVAAALAWFRLRRNCPYNNVELRELWKACQRLDAVRTLRDAMVSGKLP